jgi:hypothetical protein
LEERQHRLRPLPTGSIGFGRRPPGRYVADAARRCQDLEKRSLTDEEFNTLALDLTIARLLRTSAKQLQQYARRIGYPDCPQSAILIVTRRMPRLGIGTTGQELALHWWRRHPGQLTEVIWLSAGCPVLLGEKGVRVIGRLREV